MSLFVRMLEARWAAGKFACVGLDPRFDQIHKSVHTGNRAETLLRFSAAIVESTGDDALSFKLNMACWAKYGAEGLVALRNIIEMIHMDFPGVPVCLDHKLGDIGSTNAAYAEYVFDTLGADAVTLNPYLGREANAPFLAREDKGCIWLVKTSNPGSGEFQDQLVLLEAEQLDAMMDTSTWGLIEHRSGGVNTLKLHELVAHNIEHFWNPAVNCAIVVGATYPEELARIRAIASDMPILIPGIGAQGGDLQATVKAGLTLPDPEEDPADSCNGIIVNSSRGVIHKSEEEDFAEVAGAEVIRLNSEINRVRAEVLAAA